MTAIAPFAERCRRALDDPRLAGNLLAFQRAWRTTRDAAFDHLAALEPTLHPATPDFTSGRARLVAAKDAVLADPAAMRARFAAAARAAGVVIHETGSAAEARATILGLLRERDVRLLAKGKSMVAEEIFLNGALEAAGLRVVETDLGEWIIQLAGETPSHMVMPAIHKSRQQVAALFEAETGRPVPRDDIGAQVALARAELRRVFLQADAGLIGANALIAETGTVMLVTNEGNGDLVSTLPPLLIVLAGWEKLLPTWADAAAQLRVLARSGTGQEITSYTSFLTGPEPGRELHLVLLDNGRSAMAADPAFRDALRCIRCAACADVCPPYQIVGGHVFGYVYSGAIGLVNTAFHHGLAAAADPQALCVQCGACATVCPAEIPLPRQILAVRERVVAARGLPLARRAALAVWSHPRLFDLAARVAVRATAPWRRGRHLALPLPAAWRWRTPPAPARRPARDRLFGRTFAPNPGGPWSASKAAGLTVACFIQCLADRFAPEQAYATIQVLRACGVRVTVPAAQHCCGLPALDAGDPTTARRMAKQTIAALEGARADFVVTGAASCAVMLQHDYPRLLAAEPAWRARAERLAARSLDLLTFLRQVADPPALPVMRSAPPTTCHTFCQSANVLGLTGVGADLLRRAGYPVAELPEDGVCCGFGGSASLEHPAVARGIVARKLANVAATGARVLASDNPGCLLHLRGAAHAAGQPLQVRHVAELLAARLRMPGRTAPPPAATTESLGGSPPWTS